MHSSPLCFRAALAALLILSGLAARVAATDRPLTEDDYGQAMLVTWVQPAYPAAAAKAKQEGVVTVELVVDAEGRVTSAEVTDSTNPVFDEAAVAAVKQWGFRPALEAGKPVISALTVPVVFRLAQLKQKSPPLMPRQEHLPRGLPLSPARPVNAPDPEYPAELEAFKLPGLVRMEFTVDAEGRTREPRVQWASHPAFVAEALRAMEQTTFEPARQGRLAKPTVVRYPVSFSVWGSRRPDILAAVQVSVVGEAETLPGPFVIMEPVLPLERLRAGETGSATAEFTVNARGDTEAIEITAASGTDYAAALRAAVEAWGFQPAKDANGVHAVRLRAERIFAPGEAEARLLAALAPGGAGIEPARGLDEPLRPLWRGFPVYPRELRERGLEGKAEVEFIIDRDGRVRLPRILTATEPAFGWAAVTAVSQWVFQRPKRGGVPVDVKVQVELSFRPPAAEGD